MTVYRNDYAFGRKIRDNKIYSAINSTMKNKRHNAGFTLIELMVTLMIAAIVLSYGVPNFRSLVQNNRQSAQMNNFLTAMMLARSEAVKRHNRVTVCKSADGQACDVSARGWQQGWIVFDDPIATGVVGVVDAATDIIRVYDGFDSTATLTGNGVVVNRVTYRASGLSVNMFGTFVYCDDRVPVFANNRAKARVLMLSATGRARVRPGDDADVPAGAVC